MKRILCFGDSNTWGYDYTTYDPALGSGQRMAFHERWPGIVQNLLGPDYRIIEDASRPHQHVEDPTFLTASAWPVWRPLWMRRLRWIWSSFK